LGASTNGKAHVHWQTFPRVNCNLKSKTDVHICYNELMIHNMTQTRTSR
ncbi:hypothetical protein RSAG8_00693, partial [Rhizoctonia solani AG-8 WAC10335]